MRPWLVLIALSAVGADNPHGAADQCGTCHVGDPPGAPKPVAETCETCHPGEDHHPTNVLPAAIEPAPGWPLEAGQVACSTCHAEPAHKGLADLPVPYLRGGPYAEATAFCYACHQRTAVARSDPHHPDTAWAPDDPTCGACHDGIPERDVAPEGSRLRLGAASVCGTCHPGVPHWGMPLHVGKTVSADVRAALPPEIHVLADGAIACWTCHDVHGGHPAGDVGDSLLAKGLREAALAGDWSDIPADAILPGSDPEHPPMLARPLEKSALCASCHGDGP